MQGKAVFLRMDFLTEVKARMRSDWDVRARANAERAIYSRDAEGDVAGFAESGRANYDQLVRPFLPVLLNGRDPRECRAVEIGCGAGRMTEWFARDFGEVDAFDVSPEMITRARARLGDGIRWHVGSGATLDPSPDACADLVFSYIVFQHIPSREVVESYVREAARVLRPGGWFKFQVSGVEFPHEPDTWLGVTFTEAAAVEMAEGAGLLVVGVEGPGTQYLTLTTRKGPMPARTFVLPGEPWSAEHLVEGFGDAVDRSWRPMQAKARVVLDPPSGARSLYLGVYFWPDSIPAVLVVNGRRLPVGCASDHFWNIVVQPQSSLEILIEGPAGTSPAFRVLGWLY